MKPKTKRDWAFYRASLYCGIGKKIIAGKDTPPDGFSVVEYALYNLLDAVQEIADGLNPMEDD